MMRAIVTGRPHYLILHVNSICNARCRMCFNHDHMDSRRDAKGLPVEQLAALAASMKPLPQVTLSGGEPLLRNDVADIVAAFYNNASTRFFTLPTNALLPEKAGALAEFFASQCPRAFLNFCLPFHGVGDQFDDVMGVAGAFNKLQLTIEKLREIRSGKGAENVSFTLNFVMSKFNFQNWRETIDAGVKTYPDAALGIAFARGVTHEPDAVDVPVSEYVAACEYLSALNHKKNRNPFVAAHRALDGRINSVVAAVAENKTENLNCGAGRHLLVVYDDGSVYPCELLEVMPAPASAHAEPKPASAKLGNLRDYDFDMKRLLDSRQARDIISWIRGNDCACTWECAIYSKIVHSPTEIARLALKR